MSDRIIYINFDSGNLIDNEGALIMQPPSISYKAFPSWEVHFVRVYDDGTISGVDMTQGVSYNAAVDLDFNIDTEPLIRTLDSGIDHSQAASGIITLGLDAGTEGFLSAVNGRNSVQGWFELRGYDSTDRCIYDYRIKCNCLGAIDPNSGEPIPIPSGGVTLADVYALLRSAPAYRWSSDGEEWHNDQRPTDHYYQTCYDGGDWSQTIAIQNGQDAPALQIKYSTDGTSYHDSPTSADFYMEQSVDGGSTWTSGILFRGKDGEDGVGFDLLGAYNASTTYNPVDVNGKYECVTYEGSTYAYTALTAGSGNPPTDTTHWTMIAQKGDTGSVEDITTAQITDLDSYMSGQLSSYAKAGEVYTIQQLNPMLDAKANANDVYTSGQVDANFLKIADAPQASYITDKVTISQWTSQNTTFQNEIDYLSGQISGGGGDLSNYYTKSEVNSISAYLQNEIDNIPSGGGSVITGGISGVNLNGTPLQNNNGFVNVTALPLFTSMPAPSSTQLEHLLYLGETLNGDNYNGKLYTTDDPYNRDDGLQLQCDYLLTGNLRVWTGLGNDMLSHWFKVAYANGQWEFYESQDSSGTPIGYERTGVLSYPYASGQPWGEYAVSSQYGMTSGFTWTLTPYTGFTAAENGCIYKHISNASNLILVSFGGPAYELVKTTFDGNPNFWYDKNSQEPDMGDRVRIYWEDLPPGEGEGQWKCYDGYTTYITDRITFCQPWELNGQVLTENGHPDEHCTLHVERVYNLGAWKPINRLPSYI